MDNQPFSHLFQNDLLDGEKIRWTGTPDVSLLHFLRIRIIPVAGFTIFVGILILAFLLGLAGDSRPDTSRLIFVIVFAMLFLVVSVPVLLDWRYKSKELGFIHYAVTDKRILIRDRKGVLSAPINSIPGIVKTNDTKTTGTIRFQVVGFPMFYRIRDVDNVYKMITELQSQTP